MTRVQVARGEAELRHFVSDWAQLARVAIEPNVFYEPFMLLPAVAKLHGGQRILTVFVRSDEGALIGVFPLKRALATPAVPAPHYVMWKHEYCFLCTPLLRPGFEQSALQAAFDWISPRAALRFALHPAEGEFDRALQKFVLSHGRILHTTLQYERPMVATRSGPEEYFLAVVPPRKRKQLRRLRRRLCDLGTLATHTYRSTREVERGVTQFVELENKGWKGRAGTSFASNPSDVAFLMAAARQGAQNGQVEVRSLTLDDKPVAMGVTLRAGRGAFAFKIAYDEDHAECSPGVLLDIEMFRELLVDPGVSFIDSCSDPDYPMQDPHWAARRAIRVATVTDDSWIGRSLGESGARLLSLSGTAKAWVNHLDPAVQERLRGVRRALRTTGLLPS